MRIQEKALQAVSQLMSFNMLMWLTMLILFAAILFLAAAGYMAMASVLAPALAALFTGIGLLILFAVLALAILALTRRATAHSPAKTQGSATAEHDADDAGSNKKPQWLENNHDMAIAGTVAAGVALAASPGLRRMLVRAAGPILIRSAVRTMKKYVQ